MVAPGVYDLLWLVIAATAWLPAVVLETCVRALDRFSRKALLEHVPEADRAAVETSLSRKDDYADSLRFPASFARLIVIVSLVVGRWTELSPAVTGGGTGSVALAVLQLTAELAAFCALTLHFAPTILARLAAEGWVRRSLPWIERIDRIMRPLRDRAEGIGRIASALFGRSEERTSADIAEEEIRTAVEEGQREGLLETRDIDMIESIMRYRTLEVSEVMTPRTDMVCLDVDQPLSENLRVVVECGHSRIPVYRGDKDHVTGILYVKDLQRFWYRQEEVVLEDIVRPASFVGEAAKIGALLHEFKGHRRHLAIVQDDHGGTAGLVTIEDILEEIVGEISDEYESVEKPVRRLARGLVEVEASMHIDDLNDILGMAIPEGETYDTLGGFLFESMGHVPVVGETYRHDGCAFEVIEADDRRVHRLRLRLADSPSSGAGTSVGPSGGK